jgi:hypothetical protein
VQVSSFSLQARPNATNFDQGYCTSSFCKSLLLVTFVESPSLANTNHKQQASTSNCAASRGLELHSPLQACVYPNQRSPWENIGWGCTPHTRMRVPLCVHSHLGPITHYECSRNALRLYLQSSSEESYAAVLPHVPAVRKAKKNSKIDVHIVGFEPCVGCRK